VISILGVDTPTFQKLLPRPFISYRTDGKTCTRALEVVYGSGLGQSTLRVRKWDRISCGAAKRVKNEGPLASFPSQTHTMKLPISRPDGFRDISMRRSWRISSPDLKRHTIDMRRLCGTD